MWNNSGVDSPVAAREKIELRCVKASRDDSLRYWGIFPFSAAVKLLAAAMTASAAETVGFDMNLCLWKTVAKTLVVHEAFIHMVQAW